MQRRVRDVPEHCPGCLGINENVAGREGRVRARVNEQDR